MHWSFFVVECSLVSMFAFSPFCVFSSTHCFQFCFFSHDDRAFVAWLKTLSIDPFPLGSRTG